MKMPSKSQGLITFTPNEGIFITFLGGPPYAYSIDIFLLSVYLVAPQPQNQRVKK